MDTWNAPRCSFNIQVNGKRGPGRPKKTWKQLTERDCRELKLSAIDPHDRDTWRSGVRSAMPAASQLPGGGPLLWIWPLHLHINKKSDDDDEMSWGKCHFPCLTWQHGLLSFLLFPVSKFGLLYIKHTKFGQFCAQHLMYTAGGHKYLAKQNYSQNKITVNSLYLKVQVHSKLLVSQSEFSGPSKFTLRYK